MDGGSGSGFHQGVEAGEDSAPAPRRSGQGSARASVVRRQRLGPAEEARRLLGEKPARRVASRQAASRSAALDEAHEVRARRPASRSAGGWPPEAAARPLVGIADHRLEGRDDVADHVFGRVVQEQRQPPSRRQVRPRDGRAIASTSRQCCATEKMCAPARLPVPARDAGEAVGDVVDLDVERRGVEEVEAAAREHALPGARRLRACAPSLRLRPERSRRTRPWRKQPTRWSLTMPTACMKA